MKLLSFLTLSALLSLSACSHHKKACCSDHGKTAATCTQEGCQKACCDKDKKCADGSCTKEKKACCNGDSCEKKKS